MEIHAAACAGGAPHFFGVWLDVLVVVLVVPDCTAHLLGKRRAQGDRKILVSLPIVARRPPPVIPVREGVARGHDAPCGMRASKRPGAENALHIGVISPLNLGVALEQQTRVTVGGRNPLAIRAAGARRHQHAIPHHVGAARLAPSLGESRRVPEVPAARARAVNRREAPLVLQSAIQRHVAVLLVNRALEGDEGGRKHVRGAVLEGGGHNVAPRTGQLYTPFGSRFQLPAHMFDRLQLVAVAAAEHRQQLSIERLIGSAGRGHVIG